MIYREDLIDIELNSGTINRSFLNHAIGKGDNLGNRYGMRIFRGGVAVDLTNAVCEGFFINPRGEHILINGENTFTGNNVAYVQLPQACYNYEGSFQLTIKVISPDVVESMRIVDGTIINTGVDNAVAPVGAVPSYVEFLAVYQRMLEIAGVGKETHGEGNANQVDGYHAADLLSIINGIGRQLIIKTGRIGGTDSLVDNEIRDVSFDEAFPNACVYVTAIPLVAFNVLSTVSITDKTVSGFGIRQVNENQLTMAVDWIAIGY